MFRDYLRVIHHANLYDDEDLAGSTTSALAGPDGGRPVGEIGAVLVYLPAGQTPAEARFLQALSRHTSVDIALARLEDSQADRPSQAIASALGMEWVWILPVGGLFVSRFSDSQDCWDGGSRRGVGEGGGNANDTGTGSWAPRSSCRPRPRLTSRLSVSRPTATIL